MPSLSISRVRSAQPTGLLSALAVFALAMMFTAPASAQQTATSVRARAEAEARGRRAAQLEGSLGVIDGVVTDTLLNPMNVANVSVVGIGARVVTAANGRFRFLKVPPGQYLLVVRRIGYAPVSGVVQVAEADTVRLAYTLARSILPLDTFRVNERRVSMRMLGFEARAKSGFGQFITQEQIEQRSSLQAMDYLRQMRGIEVSRNTSMAFGGTFALSRREGGGLAGGCPMQILLDGIVLPQNFNLELLPPPKQLAGIEVYSGAATVPPQFGGGDRRCGLIAFWTRDGY